MKSLVSSQFIKKAGATALTALSFAVIGSSPAQAANLIKNGSFETGLGSGGLFSTLDTGSTAIDGWFVTQGSIDYITGYWQNADGHRSLDLNALEPGGIAQNFSTIAGKEYQVNFMIAGNPQGSPFLKKMQVNAAGQTADFSFDITGKNPNNMGWQEVSWKFTAIDLKTTLEFKSLTTEPKTTYGLAYGMAVDKVSVVAVAHPTSVPEPGMLAGLFLLSSAMVFKKRVTS